MGCAFSLGGQAAYPDKPIRIVTPFPAGSVTDVVARPIAAKLTEAWGVPVIVDNRGGAGSTPHLGGALFSFLTGVQMIHVTYKGGSPQYTIDLISGRIELAFASMAPVIPHVKSGRLKVLGTSADKRDPQFPDVPAIAESGVPGYNMSSWYGVLVTAGTPQASIDKLNTELIRIFALPDVRTTYLAGGLHAVSSSTAEFETYIKTERDKWARVVKAAGIKAE